MEWRVGKGWREEGKGHKEGVRRGEGSEGRERKDGKESRKQASRPR